MPEVTWNETVIDGKRYLVISVAQLRIPLDWDPSSNVFIAVAAPTGGVFNYPALVAGDPGVTPDIDTSINFTPIPYNSADQPFASFTETAPNQYKLNLGLKQGAPGADGNTVLEPNDFADPGPDKVIVLNSAGTAFVLRSQKVGDSYYPAIMYNAPTGNPAYTLGKIAVPPQPFDWRPQVSGQCLIQGTGADIAVDLLARLNGETAGNIVGRGMGQAGQFPATHSLIDGAPWSLHNDEYDKVLEGAPATIFIRAERRTGTETFSTSASNTFAKVKVCPCP